MKRWIITVVAWTIFAVTAQARLGQSMDEVEKQYGKATTPPYTVEYIYRDYGDKQAWYEKNGIKFLVVFKDGKSQLETISKSDSSDTLTRSEVTAFLSANASGANWLTRKEILSGTRWDRDDGGANAYLTDDQKTLTVKITSGGSKGF